MNGGGALAVCKHKSKGSNLDVNAQRFVNIFILSEDFGRVPSSFDRPETKCVSSDKARYLDIIRQIPWFCYNVS